MSDERVMLLIDADNVSVDVIEQAVAKLLIDHGALHVRRAYCTAESALKHQQLFKRLSIKPMVNLAAGKNSTDIALAVDALDLVLAERPDVVVIASSDSDFAPLVSRLREKGCRVRGIGQEGKVGEETEQIYDDFTVLEHHRSRATTTRSPDEAKPARKTAARKTSATTAAKKAPARKAAAAKSAPAKAPAAKPAAKKTRTRKAAAPAQASVAASPAPAPEPPMPSMVAELLRALPTLAQGESVELQKASELLRKTGLLSKRSTSRRLFGMYPEWFELQPHDQPSRVTARRTRAR